KTPKIANSNITYQPRTHKTESYNKKPSARTEISNHTKESGNVKAITDKAASLNAFFKDKFKDTSVNTKPKKKASNIKKSSSSNLFANQQPPVKIAPKPLAVEANFDSEGSDLENDDMIMASEYTPWPEAPVEPESQDDKESLDISLFFDDKSEEVKKVDEIYSRNLDDNVMVDVEKQDETKIVEIAISDSGTGSHQTEFVDAWESYSESEPETAIVASIIPKHIKTHQIASSDTESQLDDKNEESEEKETKSRGKKRTEKVVNDDDNDDDNDNDIEGKSKKGAKTKKPTSLGKKKKEQGGPQQKTLLNFFSKS
ncbi:hypothetical protein HK096_000061, partial [Nowakowskiella sp. JEL0078]